MGRFFRWICVVAIVAATLHWWLWLDHRMPPAGGYALDVAAVRRHADALRGPKPDEIRYEKVSAFAFPQAMVVTGGSWSTTEMPAYAYQLRYPDGSSIVVDTAMDRSLAKPDFMVPYFDDVAFDRVERALDVAGLIVLTHEHFDHSGGLANHPRLTRIWHATRLSDAQVANVDRMAPADLPAELLDGYQSLRYVNYHALAPGVVLIASPGHTPGSQMVYVQLADGRELLLLGDVAWKADNIAAPRQRPRFVTALLVREDREAVYAQLQALNRLTREVPELRQIPGHDATVVDSLSAQGYLLPGFVLP